ncbi:MAG TPA: IS630 family transposase, partial [Gemmatimonadales bacterium]|nr:IS630 family transposase [Gemmatimonadales bacterium]
MTRRIHLQPHLSVAELERRYRAAKEPHERSWWRSGQILWLLGRGQLAKDIAESTGYSRYWIGQLVRRYNTQGPAGMHNRQH